MKPEGYPLPWCEALDLPYWQVNLFLCARRPGWREFQTHKDMRDVISAIDDLIGKRELGIGRSLDEQLPTT